eukprot:COSAG06_NODE_681_length_13133_cov_6.625547_13_plen_102_part_00
MWHASPDPDSDGNCDWHVKIRANSDWVPLFNSSTDSDLLYACSSTGGSSSEILNTNAVVNDYSPHKLESTRARKYSNIKVKDTTRHRQTKVATISTPPHNK